MITLRGTYADECNGPLPDEELTYNCRVMPAYRQGEGLIYVNGIGSLVNVQDGDVLKVCGGGTWFAHYVNVRKEKCEIAELAAAINARRQ